MDNGEGIDEDRISQIGKAVVESQSGTGMALYNINRRLTMMFGLASSLKIESIQYEGTRVYFKIPYQEVIK